MNEFDSLILTLQKGSGYYNYIKTGIKIRCLYEENKKIFFIKKYFALMSFLIRNKYDVIHYHSGGIGILFVIIICSFNAKIIHHLHCGNLTCKKSNKRIPMFYRFFYNLMDSFTIKIAVSDVICKFYRKEIKNHSEVKVITNGINDNIILAQKMNFAVGFLGQINFAKGFDLFIDIYNERTKILTPINFIAQGDLFEEFRNNSVFHKTEGNYFHYNEPEIDVEPFFRRIDLLLFLSKLKEGNPLSILEAVSYNVAIITIKNEVNENILGNYPLFVDKLDKELIFNKINEFYSGQVNKNLLLNIHRNVIKKFNLEETIRNIRGIYLS